jgi:CzcA family heavy metal efflux pump
MLNRIIKFSLENKFLILLAAVLVMALGLYTTLNMEIDVFPDLTAPTVVVMTDAHGMAAEEVERLVTFPIETAVNGATDVRRVRSSSAQGYSFVWVEFDWGTDIFRARQIVSEKIGTVAAQMPIGVDMPIMAPQSSVMGEIFFLGLQSEKTDPMTLRTLAEWSVKPLLLATTGVSQVTIVGGDYKQYHVLADPQKMRHYHVTFSELAAVCRGMSRNSTGGTIRQHGNEFVVRGMGRTFDPQELGETFIKMRRGKPVCVTDVAEVKVTGAVKMGYAAENGKPAVIVSVSKQPGANTLDLTRRIEANLAELGKTLPPDIQMDTRIFRQADFIETSIGNVQRALIEGSLFVIIVLFMFLGGFRTTLISLIAMPISLLGSIIVLNRLGLSINTMSLGGMAIAIGSLVDDAIIDVENVTKRLRQNHLLPPGERRSAFDVVFEASKEIRSSILNATLIIIVAFLPLFFLSGMEGRMLQPLGISFVVSLFISLIVAMTLTPLLCRMFLSHESFLNKTLREPWLTRALSSGYQRSLAWALKRRKGIIAVALLCFVLAIVTFFSLGRSFLPEFNEGSLTLSVVCKPGTSLEESNRLGSLIEGELLAVPEVISTARRTGRGELDEHSQTVNSAEIDVNFTLGKRTRQDFLAEVRSRLAAVPGIASTVGQPLGHRIDHMLSGTRANIAIKLFGNDLSTLFHLGSQVQNAISDVKGLVDLSLEQQVEVPQIQIRANRTMLAAHGIDMGRFNDYIDIAYGGEKLADIYEGQMRFDLLLRLNQDYTETIDGIRSAPIDTEDGRTVPLEQVADIVSVTGPSSISRENVQRKIVVSANVADRDLHSVIADIRRELGAKVTLPQGYRIEYGGQFESEARASRTLLLTSILSLVIIFLLLFLEFRDFKLSTLILLNLPLALIGGVFSIYVTSGTLSIPAIIGFITLFGIATRNGILLISRYQEMEKGGASLEETVTRGSLDRLTPILMTALTSALALIPLVLQGDQSGNEIQSPMAQVILGGLLTSTLLNIYFIPVVYSLFRRQTTSPSEEA